MAKVDIVAQHGWGFGADCWDGWRELLPADFALHCIDRGYFGRETTDSPPRPHIIVAHSLGLHLLAPELIASAELLVVLGGFRHFHAADEHQARRSRRMVRLMLARLEHEPTALLADFYNLCGIREASSVSVDVGGCGIVEVSSLAIDRLHEDLELLQQSVLKMEWLFTGMQILILHGVDDRIVPLVRAEELHGLLTGSALRVFSGAGHALPVSHAQECWQQLARAWCLRHPLQ